MRPSSAPAQRQGPRSLITSRSSIIGSACTQPWAIARQPRRGPAWRRSLCAWQHDILISSLHTKGGGPVHLKGKLMAVSALLSFVWHDPSIVHQNVQAGFVGE